MMISPPKLVHFFLLLTSFPLSAALKNEANTTTNSSLPQHTHIISPQNPNPTAQPIQTIPGLSQNGIPMPPSIDTNTQNNSNSGHHNNTALHPHIPSAVLPSMIYNGYNHQCMPTIHPPHIFQHGPNMMGTFHLVPITHPNDPIITGVHLPVNPITLAPALPSPAQPPIFIKKHCLHQGIKQEAPSLKIKYERKHKIQQHRKKSRSVCHHHHHHHHIRVKQRAKKTLPHYVVKYNLKKKALTKKLIQDIALGHVPTIAATLGQLNKNKIGLSNRRLDEIKELAWKTADLSMINVIHPFVLDRKDHNDALEKKRQHRIKRKNDK